MNKESIVQIEEKLKRILGKKKFRELLDHTPDVLDVKIGKNHCVINGIIATKVINRFVYYIGKSLAEGKKIEDIENVCNPKYKDYTFMDSMQELYDTYKEYIDDVKDYYLNNIR